MSHKFNSNPPSFFLSRIFRKQESNKGQLILSLEIVKKTSRDRMQRPQKVCDRMLPRSSFPVAHDTYISQIFGQISEKFDFRFHSHCSCIVIRRASQNIQRIFMKCHYARIFPGDQPLTRSRRNSGLEIGSCTEHKFKTSKIPISRVSKGNENWFEKSGVREIEGGIK